MPDAPKILYPGKKNRKARTTFQENKANPQKKPNETYFKMPRKPLYVKIIPCRDTSVVV